jgi:CDP-diacylglycerol--glycerol-3-phosphate 3-phosphatidyltransferase
MSNQKKKGMNLPNILTVVRICMVPIFIVIMMLPASVMDPMISGIIGTALFVLASLTDMLDGKIARKYNLVTDFGKLMDPLADKFMVIGAMTAIVYRMATLFDGNHMALFVITLLIVIFRELAVTSLRLVASSSGGKVVAANMMGKMKTVVQIIFVVVAIMEPVIYAIEGVGSALPAWWVTWLPLSYFFAALTIFLTIASGVNYFMGLWKYLDPEK